MTLKEDLLENRKKNHEADLRVYEYLKNLEPLDIAAFARVAVTMLKGDIKSILESKDD